MSLDAAFVKLADVEETLQGLSRKHEDLIRGFTTQSRFSDDIAKHLPFLIRRTRELREALEGAA